MMKTNTQKNTDMTLVFQMMNNFTQVLISMERSGIYIDLDYLNDLDIEYQFRLSELREYLNTTAQQYLGATPINLDSPQQLSELLFSRKLTDKKSWARVFDLDGKEKAVYKYHRMLRFSDARFTQAARQYTAPIYVTVGEECIKCKGHGTFYQVKKDGTNFARPTKCQRCNATGTFLRATENIGGFKLPISKVNVSSNGFGTDKATLEHLAQTTKNPEAKEFLIKFVEYNAISTYLDSFVKGMYNGISEVKTIGGRNLGVLRTQFMQCFTATGRLSSRNPNFQNQPRGTTFPIKGAVVSRFQGGKIVEADFAQLEFRIAAFLSQDERAIQDIKDGVDIHSMSAAALGITRQEAKAETFAPLYGAGRDWGLLKRYPKIGTWHDRLQDEAIRNKSITLPSGRVLHFPFAKRNNSGGASGATNIKNYPVQALATADIVPAFCIQFWQLMQHNKMKSVLINTVHDSICIDVHPDEIDEIKILLNVQGNKIPEIVEERLGFKLNVPMALETKIGDNWLHMEVIE